MIMGAGCTVPGGFTISEQGTLVAEGKLDTVVYENEFYELCFDLQFNRPVQNDYSSGNRYTTVNAYGSPHATACTNLVTDSHGNFEVNYNYMVDSQVNAQNKGAEIKIMSVNAYVNHYSDASLGAAHRLSTMDAAITSFKESGNVYTVGLKFIVNNGNRNGKKNNVNINVNQR